MIDQKVIDVLKRLSKDALVQQLINSTDEPVCSFCNHRFQSAKNYPCTRCYFRDDDAGGVLLHSIPEELRDA